MTSDTNTDQLARQFRRCQTLMQSYAVDLDRARMELIASRAREVTFAAQQDAALQRVAELTHRLACIHAEQARLGNLPNTESTPSAPPDAHLQAEIMRLLQNRDEAHLLRQSLSWRITRPLRALRRPRRTLRILLTRMTGR